MQRSRSRWRYASRSWRHPTSRATTQPLAQDAADALALLEGQDEVADHPASCLDLLGLRYGAEQTNDRDLVLLRLRGGQSVREAREHPDGEDIILERNAPLREDAHRVWILRAREHAAPVLVGQLRDHEIGDGTCLLQVLVILRRPVEAHEPEAERSVVREVELLGLLLRIGHV